MSIDIRLKHSSVNGKVPQPTDLSDGELALNTNAADPAIYLKDSAGAVRRVDAGAVPASDWTRAGTVISPTVAGDDVTTTGDVNAANVVATGDVQTTSLNGGPLAGFRNALINGGMEVSQRGETFTYATAGIYTADRWFVSQGDNPTTIARTGEGFTNAVGITNWLSLTSVSAVLLSQAIELPVVSNAGRSPFPVGQTYTVSCYATSGRAAQVNARWADNASLGNASDGGTGGYKAMTESPVVGTDFSRYTYSFTITGSPVASNRALVISFTFTPNGGKCQVSGFQLEPGPVATPFEHRPIGTELALCQRYYNNIFASCGSVLPTVSGGSIQISDRYPVSMRAAPTVVCVLANTTYWYGSTGGGGVATPAIVANQFFAQFIFGGLVNASGLQSLNYTADAEL